jgi:hypothetical protein
MNQDLRELDVAELDAVSGGNVLKPIADAVLAGVRALGGLLGGGNDFPIKVDLSGAAKAGRQLGQSLGGGRPQ